MSDAATSTDDLCNILPRLIWDAREQETRAEAAERELVETRAKLAAARAEASRLEVAYDDLVDRVLLRGCIVCGTTAERLCYHCAVAMCQPCIRETDARVDQDRLICDACVEVLDM